MSEQDEIDKKNSKNHTLILLESLKKEKTIVLSEKEIELEKKLLEIEDRFESLEYVITKMNQDKASTMFDSETFSILVGSIAITAAIGVVAEYFDLSKEDLDKLLK